MKNNRIKTSLASRIFDTALYIFFVLMCITMLCPFWNSFILSLMNPAEAGAMGLKLYPKEPTLSAYKYVLSSNIVIISYRNTILRTVIVTVVGTLMTFLAAYPLANKKLPLRKIITVYMLVPMFFSGGLIPSYLLINDLGIFDSFWTLILPCLVTTYNVLIARNFVMSLPESLEESALLDGASYLRVFSASFFRCPRPSLRRLRCGLPWLHGMNGSRRLSTPERAIWKCCKPICAPSPSKRAPIWKIRWGMRPFCPVRWRRPPFWCPSFPLC